MLLLAAAAGLVAANPFTSTHKVQGVNLGGWLLLEPFITPSVFQYYDCKDEYCIGEKIRNVKKDRKLSFTNSTLVQHWETFYTVRLSNSGNRH
jgi:glucan 1,3-beta-glucosidase